VGKIKDIPSVTKKTAPRKRPIFLLLPYITHTLSMRTTVNLRSGEDLQMAWSNILSTHAKLTYPEISTREHTVATYKEVALTMFKYAASLLRPHIG